MSAKQFGRVMLTAAGVFATLLCCTPQQHAEGTAGVHKFKLTMLMESTIKATDGTGKVTADNKVAYALHHAEGTVSVIIDSVVMKIAVDGQEEVESHMSKDRYLKKKRGKIVFDESLETMSPERRRMVESGFGRPILKIHVDGDGKETKREDLLPAALAPWQEMASTLRFFHAPFLKGQNKWQTPHELSVNGGALRGDLTYERVKGITGPKEDSHLVRVRVSGTMTGNDIKGPDSREVMRNAEYTVQGEQTYDPRQKEWVAGNLALKGSFDLYREKEKTTSVVVSLQFNLQALPGKP